MGEQGVIRTNISLPRELKKRMDAVQETVNWSAVASQAFEAKLLELESTKGVKTVQDMIERLRATRKKATKKDYEAGKELGQEWAKSYATAKDLEHIEKLLKEINAVYENPGVYLRELERKAASPESKRSFAEMVYFEIYERQKDTAAAAPFWNAALGEHVDKAENADFVRGFIEGSNELWVAVKDQL
jgi:hypothetical protein